MDFSEVIRELKVIYKDQLGYPHPPVPGLTEADVQRWSAWVGSRAALKDQVALYLARGFHAHELTFAFCDAVINDLRGRIKHPDEYNQPPLFWAIFLAFEEGESYRDYNRDEDPIEVYARPAIARIIENDYPETLPPRAIDFS